MVSLKISCYILLIQLLAIYESSADVVQCRQTFEFDEICPPESKVVDMEGYIDMIVKKHNTYRSELATGKLEKLPMPSALAEVEWDSDLAEKAETILYDCKYRHDRSECRRSDIYPLPGQNLFLTTFSGNQPNTKSLIEKALSSWWNENKYAVPRQISRYYTASRIVGHFTVMANYKSSRIGCAASVSSTNFFLVCNYSYTNMRDESVYPHGSGKQQALCKEKSTKYQGLCKNSDVQMFRYGPINFGSSNETTKNY